jgi:hypothetical protein
MWLNIHLQQNTVIRALRFRIRLRHTGIDQCRVKINLIFKTIMFTICGFLKTNTINFANNYHDVAESCDKGEEARSCCNQNSLKIYLHFNSPEIFPQGELHYFKLI